MRIECEFVDKIQKLSPFVISNAKRNTTVVTPKDITPLTLILKVT